jgi:[acyl-carrier-protein] S-malonyltransferase
MKNVALFSGQGSQYVGMLSDYYDQNDIAKKYIDDSNDILGYSLSDICFDGPAEKLKETRYTQPAIFLHSAIVFDLIKENYDFSATAGHSVGEYAAMYASGVISFKDALKLVSLRGELMFSAGEDRPGTMFAVIGMDDEKVIELCSDLNDDENVVVPANFNSPGQIVISGSRDYLRENSKVFKENGARMVMELPVSGAFHSPLLDSAKNELGNAIDNIEFKKAIIPIYNNIDAKKESNPKQLKQKLIDQLTSPVLWTQTLNKLNEDGYAKFVELGPGKVLQGLVKRTLKGVEIDGFDKYEDVQNI